MLAAIGHRFIHRPETGDLLLLLFMYLFFVGGGGGLKQNPDLLRTILVHIVLH